MEYNLVTSKYSLEIAIKLAYKVLYPKACMEVRVQSRASEAGSGGVVEAEEASATNPT